MAERRPISVIIPTASRAGALNRTLESLAAQEVSPTEILICDASVDLETKSLCEAVTTSAMQIRWMRSERRGAASQRNEAFAQASQPFVLFMDDDIRLEPGCLARLWQALQGNPALGGVNSMITNQSYHPPGALRHALFRFLHGGSASSYAGQWLGGALNVLPEDRTDLPEVVPVQWLNTTCTLYRREALPDPPFPHWFYGYSLSEDLWLSLEVQRRGWKVANARTARIFHDSQPGRHKHRQSEVVAMELANVWRVGREYSGLSRRRLIMNLVAVQIVKLIASLSRPSEWPMMSARLWGNVLGWREIFVGLKNI